jgi:hypothetical protein
MVKIYKERTIKIFKYLTYLFKAHLPEIVFLVIVIQILFSLNALPYFNIINKYYYYVTAIIWVLLNVLFKQYITNKKILVLGIVTFVLALPFTILGIDTISENFGFLAFLLLFTYLLREIYNQRNALKVNG